MPLTSGWALPGMSTKARALLLAFVGGLLLVGSAHAHARYLRSEPGDGAVVATSPARVDIWFTQELFRRQGENWIRVFGPGEQPVHIDEAQIDDDDRKHLWVMLRPGLEPGAYRVEWRTLSAEDGDTEEASFSFTLDPQAALTSTPMGLETPTESPAASATLPTVTGTPIAAPTTSALTPVPTATEPASGGGICASGLLPAVGLVGLALIHQRRGSNRS